MSEQRCGATSQPGINFALGYSQQRFVFPGNVTPGAESCVGLGEDCRDGAGVGAQQNIPWLGCSRCPWGRAGSLGQFKSLEWFQVHGGVPGPWGSSGSLEQFQVPGAVPDHWGSSDPWSSPRFPEQFRPLEQFWIPGTFQDPWGSSRSVEQFWIPGAVPGPRSSSRLTLLTPAALSAAAIPCSSRWKCPSMRLLRTLGQSELNSAG